MLSVTVEKKVRLSNDPNGAAWCKDENKFGQKLLEKMGWTKGKGLGANEDGMTEHVRVSLKGDKKGIGCTREHASKWLDLQDDYEAILATMNASNSSSGNNCQSQDDDKKDFISLVQISQKTKNRLHYSRFARGKDLSTKAEKDLDCVFGTRAKREEKITSEKSEEPTTVESTLKAEFGVFTTTSTTNVQDYFAKKLAEMKQHKDRTEKSEESSVPEVSQKVEFRGNTTTGSTNVNIRDCFAQKMAAMRQAKSDTQLTKLCEENEEDVHPRFFDDTNLPTVNCAAEELALENVSSKKKKKKDKKDNSEVKFTIGNSAVAYCETLRIEETFQKKEKSSKEVKETQENPCELQNSSSRKSKKQKKERDEEEVNLCEVESTDCVKPKKQKRNKEIDIRTDDSHGKESTSCVSFKKRNRNQEVEETIDSPCKTDDSDRLTSKKRKRSKGLEGTQKAVCKTENASCISSKKRKQGKETEETQDAEHEAENAECMSSNKRKRKKH